jgi:hypothetical protein
VGSLGVEGRGEWPRGPKKCNGITFVTNRVCNISNTPVRVCVCACVCVCRNKSFKCVYVCS